MGSVNLMDQAVSLTKASAIRAGAKPKSREHFEMIAAICERVADLVSVMAAATLAYGIYELLRMGKHIQYSAVAVVTTALGFAIVFVLMLDHDGAYKQSNSLLRIRETERILRVSTEAFAVVFPVTFFFLHPFSRGVVVLAVMLVPCLLVVEKQLMFLFIRHLHGWGYGLQNVVVYGAGFTGHRVFSALVRSPKLGLNPVAI